MNSFNTNAPDFRSSKRKCSFLTGCLIFVLLMSQTSCRPSETDSDSGISEELTQNDEEYMDADDIDWKTFADVETTTKFYPIIFYKEDIVSEDYDPSEEKNNATKEHDVKEIKPHHRRKYEEITRHHKHHHQTETYRYIKPEKVYFDINPVEHQVKDEASNEVDSKFNADDVRIEYLLNEDNPKTSNEDSSEEDFYYKNVLNKNPKKFNHRSRRDVTPEGEDSTSSVSLRHKRNPYFYGNSHYSHQLPQYRGVLFNPQLVVYPFKTNSGVKHPIKSPNYYNAFSPGGGYVFVRSTTSPTPVSDGTPEAFPPRVGFDDDRPVWPIESNTVRRPVTTTAPPMRTLPPRRPPPPILQFGDEDYVTSIPLENRNLRPAVSFANSAPRTTPRPTVPPTSRQPATSPPPPASNRVSACIWAISSCCTRNEQIRYQCFERLGCSGAFWDLNPCADEIFRLAVQAADTYLN